MTRTLIAGVGNIFLSDDAFGVEVLRALAADRPEPLPDGIEMADFGIRGVHLAYQLLDGYDELVIVDAAPHGQAPGTVSLLEVDPTAALTSPAGSLLSSTHTVWNQAPFWRCSRRWVAASARCSWSRANRSAWTREWD